MQKNYWVGWLPIAKQTRAECLLLFGVGVKVNIKRATVHRLLFNCPLICSMCISSFQSEKSISLHNKNTRNSPVFSMFFSKKRDYWKCSNLASNLTIVTILTCRNTVIFLLLMVRKKCFQCVFLCIIFSHSITPPFLHIGWGLDLIFH